MCMALCLTVGETAVAKVYKWTDANGKVHYGERPPRGASTKTIRVPKQGAPRGSVPATGAERRARQRKLLKAFEDDRKEREAVKAKSKKQSAKLKQACTRLHRYIDQESIAKYLYRKDNKTNTKIPVSAAERAAYVRKIRKQYKKSC